MASLIAIRSFLTSKCGGAVLAVVILSALLLLSYCTGKSDGKSGEVISQQQREIDTQNKVSKADANSAEVRLNDYQYAAEQQKEIEDAVRNSKGPDDVRAQRGCVILRQQGRDTTRIPACHRPEGGR